MSLMPLGTGPLVPTLSGIDPSLMDALIVAMGHAHATLGEQSEAIRDQLGRVDMSTSTLSTVKRIEDWAGEQLARLRVRDERIRGRVPGWGSGVVAYDGGEVPYASSEESREQGAALADLHRHYAGESDDEGLRARHRDLLDRLLARQDDADLAAAFFAGLGAERTAALPGDVERLYDAPGSPSIPADGGVPAKEQALARLATTFAAATTAARRTPRFDKVMDELARGGDDANRDGLSWLVSTGRFPTEWLTAVVRANVVLPMLSGTLRPADLTNGTTARFLAALAANPAAARAAVAGLVRDRPAQPPASPPVPSPTVEGVLTAMSTYAAGDRRTGDAFGRMLAAASGVYEEKDGAHSPDAARFAFHVIMAVPSFDLHDGMRRHLAEIGGSYVTELAARAEPHEESRFGAFDDDLQGTTPAFRLTVEDGDRFLRTFAGTNEHAEPFERGMARLTRRLLARGEHPLAALDSPHRNRPDR